MARPGFIISMTYLERLTPIEKSELDHAFIQERDSAALEGFRVDEQVFRESWAKITVNYRLQKEGLQRPKEAAVTLSGSKAVASTTRRAASGKVGIKTPSADQEPAKLRKSAPAKEKHRVAR
jgi:hypothetical protein